jgi:titin
VLNTNDSGPGSLRAAIDYANTNPGTTITFDIPKTDPNFNGKWFTITPTTPGGEPPITADGTTIDGGSEAAFLGGKTNPDGPQIEINGSQLSFGAGLNLQSADNTIRSLSIVGFAQPGMDGIHVSNSGNVIEGCDVGVDAGGAVVPNDGGIGIDGSGNQIGAASAGDGNVISGNNGQGINELGGSGNVIEGNFIGTDATGKTAVGNGASGVFLGQGATHNVVGGTNSGARNVISGNAQGGVTLAAGQNTVEGNYIGTDEAGAAALPNGQPGNGGAGVFIGDLNGAAANNNIIDGNLISGNVHGGIAVSNFADSSQQIVGTVIQGNLIGTNGAGNEAIPNGDRGVELSGATQTLIGGTTAVARNVISGNASEGIVIGPEAGSNDNTVAGNYIGTDITGSSAVPNTDTGVIVNGTGNTIGGTDTGARNVISGNGRLGVYLASDDNAVTANYIGTDAAGTGALANGDGSPGAGGLGIQSNSNTVVGNLISGNNTNGVAIGPLPGGTASGNVLHGNLIGTNAAGTSAVPNLGTGVNVFDGTSSTIGGTSSGARNIISGNGGNGFDIGGGSAGITVQGNYVGVDTSGATALGNAGFGINIANAQNTTVTGNVVSGNGKSSGPGFGLNIDGSNGTTVTGNLIGTNAGGSVAIGNVSGGVHVHGASGTVIGGTTAAARNVISGNGFQGVFVDGASSTTIEGNRVGTDVSGTAALANAGPGIQVRDYSTGTVIGGIAAGAGNLISGNGLTGVGLSSVNGAVVEGNLIGTDVSGANPLGNGGNGVSIGGLATSSSNTIGGAAPGAGNVIAFNTHDGVDLYSGTGDTIGSNSIFSNGGLGIDLGDNGVTPNDPGDTDTGPNNLQNFPLLKNANLDPVANQLIVNGSIDTQNPTSITIEFFANSVPTPGADPSGYGEGQTFLGAVTPKSNGKFSAVLPIVPAGAIISATATDANGNTSEFAADIAAK